MQLYKSTSMVFANGIFLYLFSGVHSRWWLQVRTDKAEVSPGGLPCGGRAQANLHRQLQSSGQQWRHEPLCSSNLQVQGGEWANSRWKDALVCWCAANQVAKGSTPGHRRVEDCFPILPCHHLCGFVSACRTFVCTAYTKIVANVEGPLSIFCWEKARLLVARNAPVMHFSSRIIKMVIVATSCGRRKLIQEENQESCNKRDLQWIQTNLGFIV